MKPIVPMEPVRSETIPEGKEWIAQIKWDGVRILTYYEEKKVKLFNRRLNERTKHFPEVADITSYCSADSVILDGEIIALSEAGTPSFQAVMKRDGLRRLDRVGEAQQHTPITYMVFDILFFNGEWINTKPWKERMDILSKVIIPNDTVQLVPSMENGSALFNAIKEHGMEGIIMKQINSPHILGAKKNHWLKVKNYRDIFAIIGGFTLRAGTVNAVLLGVYHEDQFVYIGHTGTGKLSSQDWKDLTTILKQIETIESPFANLLNLAGTHWVEPTITTKIMFAEWTEGMSLRQPSIQAFVDVPASECTLHQEQDREE
jgi:bifunctional non-homologous end joining protein LigD